MSRLKILVLIEWVLSGVLWIWYALKLIIVSLADYNFTLYGDQPEFFMYKFPERATTYKVNSGGWALYTEPNFQGKVMYHLGSKFLIINF